MKIRISKHVYGSIKGYQTLAISSDVTAEEVKELESVSFGQTNDSVYLQSLNEKPAFLSKKMDSSGRWAITRVFCGPQDDYGRVTLLFITVIISQTDWLHTINSDLNIILSKPELWKWDGEHNIPDTYMEVSQKDLIPDSKTVKNALSLLSVVEFSFNKSRPTIVVSESVFNNEDIRWLNMILPQKERENFSCAARALSDGLPFSLISLSEVGISGKTSNRTIRWDKATIAEEAPYTKYLSNIWVAGNRPPWDFIRSCKSFELDIKTPIAKSVENKAKRPIIGGNSEEQSVGMKKNHWKRVGIISIFSFLLFTLIALTTLKFLEYRERNRLLEEIDTFLNSHPDAMVPPENHTSIDTPINKAQSLLSKVESLRDTTSNEEIHARADKLYNWLNGAKQAKQIRTKFSDLVISYKNLVAFGLPISYPPPDDINKILNMISEFENQLKSPNIIGEEGVFQAERAQQELEGQLSSLGNIVVSLEKKVGRIVKPVPIEEKLESYSKDKHGFYVRAKIDIEMLWDNDNLNNALLSPLDRDREDAEALMNELKKTKAVCQQRIMKLEVLKAENAFDALRTRNDPNDYQKYISVQDQIEICLKYDPNDLRANRLKDKLSEWREENNDWIKAWEFINNYEKYIKQIDNVTGNHGLTKIREEIDKEKHALNYENIDFILSGLVDKKYDELIDKIEQNKIN